MLLYWILWVSNKISFKVTGSIDSPSYKGFYVKHTKLGFTINNYLGNHLVRETHQWKITSTKEQPEKMASEQKPSVSKCIHSFHLWKLYGVEVLNNSRKQWNDDIDLCTKGTFPLHLNPYNKQLGTRTIRKQRLIWRDLKPAFCLRSSHKMFVFLFFLIFMLGAVRQRPKASQC